MDGFHYWENPPPSAAGDSCRAFLHHLPGPTHIHLSGSRKSARRRCRAVVTLMHGNEPSGLHGIFELIRGGVKPLLDMEIFIPSVDAARQEPGFIYRTLPQQKDINRCFRRPGESGGTGGPSKKNGHDTEQDLLAAQLLRRLGQLKPECCIDVHNTSGTSPAFGVATFMDPRHEALVSLFTHRLVITGIKLGALMELSGEAMPIVTIECGGAAEESSHQLALAGLRRYFTEPDVLSGSRDEAVAPEFFHHPVRMELSRGSDIAYGTHSLVSGGVTLLPDVERFNFGHITPEDQLGFVSGPLRANLSAKDPAGVERIDEFFQLRDDALYPRRRLKLFMVTSNPEIARKDCLFYIVEP